MDLAPKRFGNAIVLSPAGRVDHASAESFTEGLLAQLGTCCAGQDLVVLDLSGIAYMSSAGLRALMMASKRAHSQGGTFVGAGLRPLVQEVFAITRFTSVIATFPSVRDALAALSPSALQAFDSA